MPSRDPAPLCPNLWEPWVPNISQPHKLGSTWPCVPWPEPTTSFILSSFSGLQPTCDWLGLNVRNFKTSRRFFRELTSTNAISNAKEFSVFAFFPDYLGTSWYEHLRIEPGLLHNLASHSLLGYVSWRVATTPLCIRCATIPKTSSAKIRNLKTAQHIPRASLS